MSDREYIDDFHSKLELIASNNTIHDAFKLITDELARCEDKFVPELMGSLNYLRYKHVLYWIEDNVNRTPNISQSWGHLAASSDFSWVQAKKWIKMGRPLSLIALDATMFCTTIDERLNQSPWMREINPRFSDEPNPAEIAIELNKYLEQDNVPRTKNVIHKIFENIFAIE